MIVTFNLIHLGRVISTQKKEYDGTLAACKLAIEGDQFTGMDPLKMAAGGQNTVWVEAKW